MDESDIINTVELVCFTTSIANLNKQIFDIYPLHMAQIASIRTESLENLAQHPAIWRSAELARTVLPDVSTGFPDLDVEPPGSGRLPDRNARG